MNFNNTEVLFDKNDGTVISIINLDDKDKMNWCSGDFKWGNLRLMNLHGQFEFNHLKFVGFNELENIAVSNYECSKLQLTVKRFFNDKGYFVEQYTVKNITNVDLMFNSGDLGIELPFNDKYTSADECLVQHCNTHIWCGENTAYINSLKMGDSKINLGLVVTKGSFSSYSQFGTCSNCRGCFVLDSKYFVIKPGEEHCFEWEMFWHTGETEFYKIISKYNNIALINAENFTVFLNEKISFSVMTESETDFKVLLDESEIPFTKRKNSINVIYSPKKYGEHRFIIKYGNYETYTEFFVCEEIDLLIKKRVEFIVNKQQYLNENSAFDGAYLIYDNKANEKVNHEDYYDFNSCRERIGMALLLAKYLQTHKDTFVKASLDKYIKFLFRECYDDKTGEVFNGAHRNNTHKRLYNSPWVAQLFAEMYKLTGEQRYSENAFKVLKYYYDNGGDKFYPNAFDMEFVYNTVDKADADKLLPYFKRHIENLTSNGTSYPKHEVNYEQTIVAPAVTLISQAAKMFGSKDLTSFAKLHIEPLKRFSGHQPSYHLYEIPIRFWDDYWFGKRRCYGDVFPHYWACLSASAYVDYFNITKEKDYISMANQCIRNCLCLFDEKGHGSCAYVYPFKVGTFDGAFFDEWANDQDFALYYLLKIKEVLL